MNSKLKIFTYTMVVLLLMLTSVFLANSRKYKVTIQTSGNLELSNSKIE